MNNIIVMIYRVTEGVTGIVQFLKKERNKNKEGKIQEPTILFQTLINKCLE